MRHPSAKNNRHYARSESPGDPERETLTADSESDPKSPPRKPMSRGHPAHPPDGYIDSQEDGSPQIIDTRANRHSAKRPKESPLKSLNIGRRVEPRESREPRESPEDHDQIENFVSHPFRERGHADTWENEHFEDGVIVEDYKHNAHNGHLEAEAQPAKSKPIRSRPYVDHHDEAEASFERKRPLPRSRSWDSPPPDTKRYPEHVIEEAIRDPNGDNTFEDSEPDQPIYGRTKTDNGKSHWWDWFGVDEGDHWWHSAKKALHKGSETDSSNYMRASVDKAKTAKETSLNEGEPSDRGFEHFNPMAMDPDHPVYHYPYSMHPLEEHNRIQDHSYNPNRGVIGPHGEVVDARAKYHYPVTEHYPIEHRQDHYMEEPHSYGYGKRPEFHFYNNHDGNRSERVGPIGGHGLFRGNNYSHSAEKDYSMSSIGTMHHLPHPMSSQEREGFLTYGLLILLLLVLSSMVLGHLASKFVHKGLNVPVVATLCGFATGFVLWLGGTREDYLLSKIISFNEEIFFVFILPPIIFASGFELTGTRGKLFFARFGTILWFALFATIVAFALNAAGFYLTGMTQMSITFTLPQAMALGALLSPTDPVTVLALFRETSVDPVIETVVLGESLLNDAVAILLYRMIVRNSTSMSVASDILWFGYMFVASMAIGVAVGLCISFLIKLASYRWAVNYEERVTAIETAIILVSPWFSYLIAENLELSGVVAVLFCGIAMARYAIPNFSDGGATVAKNVYSSFSQLAETVVFVLLGLSVFAFRILWAPLAANEYLPHSDMSSWMSHLLKSATMGKVVFLHLFTIVFVSLGRLISITVTAGIVNVLLKTAEGGRLPQKIQWVVSLSGLRGAMAVALALKAQSDIGGATGSAIVSTTLVYTLFTILVVGPCLPRAFKALGLEEDVRDARIRRKLQDFNRPDQSARHIMLWQYMVHGLRRLDGWVYALVTARANDGGFIGDSMLLWRPSFEEEESDWAGAGGENASTPTTVVISDP